MRKIASVLRGSLAFNEEWIGEIIVQTSKTIPLSALRVHEHDVLAMTNSGPVTLVVEEKIAGILLSPAQWDVIAKTLRAAQECLAAAEASKRQLQ